jgi:DNA-binding CsgD family transcriptional regulator
MEGVEITPRERECLEWSMEGKSRTDTAQIMMINHRMVVRDLESVKTKLGVRTVGQAIAIYAAWKATRTHLVH